jgi:L-lactate utilization protein LutC
LAWNDPGLAPAMAAARDLGVEIDHPFVPHGEGRRASLHLHAEAHAGLTGASAAIADTGTLILPSGPGRSQLASQSS